jgi:hypothetical protein
VLAKSALSVGTVLLLASSFVTTTAGSAEASTCGGTPIPLDTSVLSKPFAHLTLGGNSGNFLIDTGATQSQVDMHRYDLWEGAKVFLSGFTLPSVQSGVFSAAELRTFVAPQGTPLGTVGTDFLSLHAIEFQYEQPQPSMTLAMRACDQATLRRAGFMSVGLPGFYEADVSRLRHGMPNVPVISLRIGKVIFPAQVDTGYGDVPGGVVQVNAALMKILRVAGIHGHVLPSDIVTFGCSGTYAYERWQTESAELSIIATEGNIAARYPPPLLELKTDPQCSGISSFAEPFAQIGAFWLSRWKNTVFDGLSSTIWIRTDSR